MVDEYFEEKFQEIFSGISELYDKTPSAFLFELFFKSLERFGIDVVEKAFIIHTQDPDTGKFMPKPGDIIRIIEGSSKDTAFGAWTSVEKSIGMVGRYTTVVFDDPIIHRVIQDMGGWIRICELPEKELPFVKNEFMNRYKGFKAHGEIPDYPPMLIGITEGENRVKGFVDHIPSPTLIGNPEKAEKVLLLGTMKPSLLITNGTDSGLKQIGVTPLRCLN